MAHPSFATYRTVAADTGHESLHQAKPLGPSQQATSVHINDQQSLNLIPLISTPSLAVYYCQQLALSVCSDVRLSVLSQKNFKLLFFCFSMESSHYWAISSLYGPLQNVFFDFRFRPKICSPKLLAIMLRYHVATRGCALGTAPLPGESRQSIELRGRPLLPWQTACCIQTNQTVNDGVAHSKNPKWIE